MEPKVSISLGKLKGKTISISDKYFYSFTGVPYADVPQRFSLPKPCSEWTGTLNCTKESKMSYQPNPMFPECSYLYHGFPDDCLYLNIFTPILKGDTIDHLPVIVYFHGGAFIVGGNNTKEYGPEILLSTQNVVLVVVNYRLGPFGFLNFQDLGCPGNQGMHDQVLSLKWVQSHIHHFGGTSSNVTIMGQSAGGMSSMYHLVSPMSKSLFHKIICLSGSVLYSPFLHMDRDPLDYAKSFAESLGVDINQSVDDILTQLRRISAKTILSKMFLFKDVFIFFSCPWKPCVDGGYLPSGSSFLPDTFENLVSQGKGNTVESILMGYTAQDGLCFLSDVMKNPNMWNLIQKDWNQIAPMLFLNRVRANITEKDKETVEKLYDTFYGKKVVRPLELNEKNFRALEEMATMLAFKLPFYASAKLLHNNGYQVYGFNFNYVGTATLNDFYRLTPIKFIANLLGRSFNINLFRDSSYGAAHGDDLLYIFSFKVPGLSKSITTERDRITSKNFRNIILLFAHSGKPTEKLNQEGHFQWRPVFEEGSGVNVALLNARNEEEDWEMDKEFDSKRVEDCVSIIQSRYASKN